MDPLDLRKATALDEPSIFRLIREAHINPLGLKWPRFVVIEAPDGQVVACGQIKPHFDGTQELASLTVDKDWRGQGLARRIIEYFLACQEDRLYLTCQADLRPFYEKFGFREMDDADLPPFFRRLKGLIRIGEKLTAMRILVMFRDLPTR